MKKLSKKEQSGILKPKVTLETFKRETGVPFPARGDSQEMKDFKKKLDGVISTLKVGDSFVMLTTKVGTASRYVRSKYLELSFRFSKIQDNQAYSRVWRKK